MVMKLWTGERSVLLVPPVAGGVVRRDGAVDATTAAPETLTVVVVAVGLRRTWPR